MNAKRVTYNLPVNHSIRITVNYLIGYLEGDGSFFLNKQDMTPRIALYTTIPNRVVLEYIRKFLLDKLDKYSYILGSNTNLINIRDIKVKSGHISILEIYQIDYICNILIPYFDCSTFYTKKYYDYLDFRKIAFLIFEGKHLTEKGKQLIIELGDTMNNNRLSTNTKPLVLDNASKLEIDALIKSEPLVNIDSEGRAMRITDGRYIRSTYVIRAIHSGGYIDYYTNGVSCAKALQVSNNTITHRLNDGRPVKNKQGLIVAQNIKRIKAYSPKGST